MATMSQRKKLGRNMAMYFAERGSIPATPKEFNKCPLRPKLIKINTIQKFFKSWSTMVNFVHGDVHCREILDTITKNVPSDPLEQLRAKKTEEENGKNI